MQLMMNEETLLAAFQLFLALLAIGSAWLGYMIFARG